MYHLEGAPMLLRVVGCLFLLAGCCQAQTPFPMTFLGDIGQDDAIYEAEGMDLGVARAHFAEEGLLIKGPDAEGLFWSVWLSRTLYTQHTYRGDFDGNGKQDLLIARSIFGNGLCIDSGTFLFLMMDERGRPVPWEADSQGFLVEPGERSPILFDVNANGRAELATHECQSYPINGDKRERRWITGVFEAQTGPWEKVEPLAPGVYETAMRQRYQEYDFVDFERSPWEKEAEPQTPYEGPEVQVTGILPGGWNQGLLRYSDGIVRRGWPTVIEDAPEGRELHIAEPRWAIDRLLQAGAFVRPIGPDNQPHYLWTSKPLEEPQKAPAVRVSAAVTASLPIELVEGLPEEPKPADQTSTVIGLQPMILGGAAPRGSGGPTAVSPPPEDVQTGAVIPRVFHPGLIIHPGGRLEAPWRTGRPFGTYLSRGGRCFLLRENDGAPVIYLLPDCSVLGRLQSDAESGLRIYDRDFNGVTVVDPHSRTVSSSPLAITEYEPAPAAPGELIGAAPLAQGSIAQWTFGGRYYFLYHDAEGSPQSEPMESETAGELLQSDNQGLMLLQWEDDIPVELIRATATIEWVRAE